MRRILLDVEYFLTFLSQSRTRPAPTSPSNNGVSIGSPSTQQVCITNPFYGQDTHYSPAAKKAGKPVILEEFGVSGIGKLLL